ncbi:MAG TPA: NTP transferase domain-containing protein [Capsulimonadaceae bacterium]|nr:NTP transferase domain-containing protein [Capsulimonadaceae bacterium]
MEKIPALVVAGGRIAGEYAEAAGTTVKALIPVGGRPVIDYLLATLRELPQIGAVCVVGPEEIRDALRPDAIWEAEAGSGPANVLMGIRRLGVPQRLLLCASDTPMIGAEALADFRDRAPDEADLCLPLVPKGIYLTRYPDGQDEFVRLKEGEVTAGGQFLIRTELILRNMTLIERLFNARKSQVGMALAIGPMVVAKFLAGKLSVGDIEDKLSQLTGCRCRAVPDCRPELAFDIDDLADLRYAERLLTPG